MREIYWYGYIILHSLNEQTNLELDISRKLGTFPLMILVYAVT